MWHGIRRSTVVLTLALMAAAFLPAACGGDSDGFQLGANISISVDPSRVTFGAVPIGGQDSRRVTITSDGADGPLILRNIRLVNASAAFELVPPEETELDAGESTSLTIIYRPQDAEIDDGTLVIEHNVAGRPAVEIPITALAQLATLYFNPSPLQFGEVRTGAALDKTVRLINGGADTATITALVWMPASSDNFGLIDEPWLPLVLAPGQEAELTVRYEPYGGRSDSAELGIYSDDEVLTTLRMFGHEIAPNITISPGAVNFGWVPLNRRELRPVSVTNEGSDTLILESVNFGEAHTAVSLSGHPTEEVVLEPGESLGFQVAFEASTPFPLTTDPIAKIAFTSNDPRQPVVLIPVFARIEAPVIRVTPAADDQGDRLIDFGIIAQNITGRRELVILNAGQATLEVHEIALELGEGALEDEFGMEEIATFAPTTAAGGTGYLQPNEVIAIRLSFTNLGPDTGVAWGKVTIRSNDELSREVVVNLYASRDGAPTCDVVLEPGQVNYGTVAHGFYKDMTLRVRNIGSGYCSYMSARLSDCPVSLFPGIPTTCNLGSASSHYRVLRAPIPVSQGLAPGDTGEFVIRFEPPDRPPMLAEFNEYNALLQVTMHNPYGPAGQDNTFRYPADDSGGGGGGIFPGGGTRPGPNLIGRSGISRVSVLPDQVDFGLVTLGCASETKRACVYNSGSAALTLISVAPGPECSAEFSIRHAAIPAGGVEVTTGTPFCIEVRYLPQVVGRANCTLVVRTSDRENPTVTVPVRGEGTLETHQVDEFVQSSGQEVDILMVIDDSGSMCDLQSRLTSNLESFINHARQWDNDYQIGVTLTCITQNDRYCKVPGGLITDHSPRRWVTPATINELRDNANPGCSGDPVEAGLEAAFMALSLPNIHLSDQPCGSDRDCTAPDKCLPNIGRCGGANGGFLRRDAALEIIMFSDEEDQSPAPPDFYVDFFKGIKGFANENFLHVHAIVGDKGRGCSNANDDGSAQAGDRYIFVAEQTGGVVESICSRSFADALNNIGAIAFGLKVQFFLSRVGDPSTIEVQVNGRVCATGWLYDPPSNSIIFDENGSCMPQEDDAIRIAYEAICFTP